MGLQDEIKASIRDVPDFPKPGILFKDITPILKQPDLCQSILRHLTAYWETLGVEVVVGIESRGFLWGSSLAQQLRVPFVPVRKQGKLPADTYAVTYELEYGSATLEMHKDALSKGRKALIHDDLLATGGTAAAAAELIGEAGGEVLGFSFLVELSFLSGQARLSNYSTHTHALVRY